MCYLVEEMKFTLTQNQVSTALSEQYQTELIVYDLIVKEQTEELKTNQYFQEPTVDDLIIEA
jgi:hypothetical protein